tara:strand:+ start:53 stop:640 length:588 start_codon:yes stop_codon:yes gene_type:complete
MNEWTTDIELLLNQVRENAIYLSAFHKKSYFKYKQIGTWFRIPTIIISSLASVASVGLSAYLNQSTISATTCMMALSVGILNSIELYMKVSDHIEAELETSKSYYNLSIELHKILNLSKPNREGNPKEVLDDYYMKYSDLYTASTLLGNNYPDKLILLPKRGGVFSRKRPPPVEVGSSNSSIQSSPMGDEADHTL